jgi:hypothetical protein
LSPGGRRSAPLGRIMIRPYSRNSSWDAILRPFAFFAAILLFFGCGYAALGPLWLILFFLDSSRRVLLGRSAQT